MIFKKGPFTLLLLFFDLIKHLFFELPSVHRREKTSQSLRLCGLAFQSGEKKRGSFLCSSDMLIAISIEIAFL